MRDAILGPQPADDADGLREPADALRHGHAVDGVLLRAIAEPDAEQELAAGDHIHEGADLGQLDRVVQGQQRDVGAEPQSLGVGSEALQQAELREEVEAGRDMMLAGPDRIEAEGADQAHLLQRLGEAAGGVVARGVLRVQVDAELHGIASSCCACCGAAGDEVKDRAAISARPGCDFNHPRPAPIYPAPTWSPPPVTVSCRIGRG